jgi:hypothetical protein
MVRHTDRLRTVPSFCRYVGSRKLALVWNQLSQTPELQKISKLHFLTPLHTLERTSPQNASIGAISLASKNI